MDTRNERIREALRETAAEFLAREAGRQSLITVTNTRLSEDGKRALIFITVLPEKDEAAALAFAQRHRGELAKPFKEHIRGAMLPHVEYRIDTGEKSRQRLDDLSLE
jgi:ribosome-binding factor A